MGAAERNIASLDYLRLINQIYGDVGQSQIPAENLHQLYLVLETAHKVKSENIPDNVVTMNSNVVIKYMRSGITKTIRIVYPGNNSDQESARDSRLDVSVYDPLAISLLGLKEQDVCFSRLEEGEEMVLIDKILFQPEAHRLFNL